MWEYADAYKKEQFAISYITLHEWIYKKQSGRGSLKVFFEKYGYKTIAFYGLGTLGDIFINQAISEGIQVSYVIDKRAGKLQELLEIPVILPENIVQYKEVDVVIICNTFDYNSIADELVKCGIKEEKILSINDVVFAI